MPSGNGMLNEGKKNIEKIIELDTEIDEGLVCLMSRLNRIKGQRRLLRSKLHMKGVTRRDRALDDSGEEVFFLAE